MFWRKEKRPYKVTVHLDGRHPYLDGNELDYETRDVTLVVPATGWSNAAEVALEAARGMRCWSRSVNSIERVEP